MRTIKVFGLALVAMLALVAVSAASASASLFDASKVGKLTGKATKNQVFITKAGTVTCKAIKVTASTVEPLASETQLAVVEYEECTVFGFLEAKISPAHYLFMSNGTADLKAVETIEAPGCTVTVPIQSGLGTITYKDSGEGIELEPNVTGIESEGTGSTCSYAKEKAGTYKGQSKVELEGGKIEWMST